MKTARLFTAIAIVIIAVVIFNLKRNSAFQEKVPTPVRNNNEDVRASPSLAPKEVGPVKTVSLPFLGDVSVNVQKREFQVKQNNGSIVPMRFDVAQLADGRFVSAEYTRTGATRYWPTAERAENEH